MQIMKTLRSDRMTIEVLLVEDSPGDARLTKEAFQENNPVVRLNVVADGVEAMAYLRHLGPYAQAPRPDLILLDLNMPKMDGREVLAQIKKDANLKTIPTIILSTSEAQSDIETSYRLQANCYLNKPVLFEDFDSLVKNISSFWLKEVTLPLRSPRAMALA